MAIDAALGRLGIKAGVCTSSTRPANPYEGQVIYETDTNRTLVYDNSAWLVVADNQVLSIDTTNSRVGIGTTTPAQKLHVKGDNEGIRIEDGSAADHYDIYRHDATGYLKFTGSQTTFSGYDFEVNNGTNVMRINNSGNVGINDSTPSYTLDVNGDINASGDLRIGGTAIGEWTTFTPTFNNVTLGASGYVVGRYTEVNDLVFYSAKFDLGGTGSIGGHISLTPPVGTADYSTNYAVAHQAWYRPQGGTIYHGMGFASAANIYFYAYALTGSYQTATQTNATTPITWTSAGIFYCQGWYAKV